MPNPEFIRHISLSRFEKPPRFRRFFAAARSKPSIFLLFFSFFLPIFSPSCVHADEIFPFRLRLLQKKRCFLAYDSAFSYESYEKSCEKRKISSSLIVGIVLFDMLQST